MGRKKIASERTLADLLEEESTLSMTEIVSLFERIAKALLAVHDEGEVIKDLQPLRIAFSESGEVVFRKIPALPSSESEDEEVLGSVDYLSPEYLECGEFDQRSDIYALGIIMYELISGSPPFHDEGVVESINRRLSEDPPSPHKDRIDCPPELGEVVLRAMARDPHERYDSVQQLLAELAPLRHLQVLQ